jgi:hypothetical protein
MASAVVLASSVLAVVLVIALAREVRLRRALQKLLPRLLDPRRSPHETSTLGRPGSTDPARPGLARDRQ